MKNVNSTLSKSIFTIALLFASWFLFIKNSHAQNCTIKISAPEYANVQISFFIIEDLITETEKTILTSKIDESGNLNETITLDNITQVYCYLGIYKCIFYAEPHKEYDLALPPRRDIGLAQELNPYFVHELIKIGIKNSNEKELNYLISQFDNEYNSFITENFYWIYITSDLPLVDSIEQEIEKKYGNTNNSFLDNYIYYKLAGLRHLAYDRDMYYAVKKYISNKPFALNNEAYNVFFNEMFTGYFTVNYSDGLIGELHEAVIFYKSPYRLKQLLEKKISFRNDTLKELIILRGLYDAYSKPEIYPRHTVDQTLDSLMQLSTNPYVKQAALNIFKKVDKSFVGDEAPIIKGVNPEGDSVAISDYKGKYLYIQFCRSENYACQQDYRLIKDLHMELPSEELEIVTLSYDQDQQTFVDYITRNNQYTWSFIHTTDKDAIKLFNVKAMPTYILLDPDGKIAMNPAPSPHENFKYYFGMIIKWRETAKKMQEEYNIPQE